jgi:hypothetical protein
MKLKSKITIIYEDLTRDETVYFIESEKKNEHVEWFLFFFSQKDLENSFWKESTIFG